MFGVATASLQTFIDMPNCVLEDRVQCSTVHIPNVFCDGHLQIISCVGIIRIHWVQVHRDFLITLYLGSLVTGDRNVSEEITNSLIAANRSHFGLKSQFKSQLLSKSNPITGLDRPWGFQEVEAPRFQDNRHMKVVRLSALCTGCLYPRKYSWYSFLLEAESTLGP